MTNTNDNHNDSDTGMDLLADIDSAARIIAHEWPGIIDADDARQEIWVKLLGSASYIDDLTAMSATQRLRALALIGHQVAARYRSDYDRFSGNFLYSTREVRELLELDALRSQGDAFQADHLDVRNAYRELSSNHTEILSQRYLNGQAVSDTKALTRAVDALTRAMNRRVRERADVHDGPGSRRVMSNATSQALTARSQ